MNDEWKTCWRCGKQKLAKAFLENGECLMCWEDRNTEDAPSLAVIASRAVHQKKGDRLPRRV